MVVGVISKTLSAHFEQPVAPGRCEFASRRWSRDSGASPQLLPPPGSRLPGTEREAGSAAAGPNACCLLPAACCPLWLAPPPCPAALPPQGGLLPGRPRPSRLHAVVFGRGIALPHDGAPTPHRSPRAAGSEPRPGRAAPCGGLRRCRAVPGRGRAVPGRRRRRGPGRAVRLRWARPSGREHRPGGGSSGAMSEPPRSPPGSLPLSRLAEPVLRRLSELLDRAAPGKGWRDLAQRAGSRGRVRLR